MNNPYTKDELREALAGANQGVADYFTTLPAAAFFAHPTQVWSPAENLLHLGKLTVREMLLFTHYHNAHHAAGMGD
ncbi:MAG: hypothetical protein AB1791_16140 [Chloroflexota bacterium]